MNIISQTTSICKYTVLLPLAECSYKNNFKSSGIEFVHINSWGSSPRGFRCDLKKELKRVRYDYVWINACLMSNKAVISIVKNNSKAKIITHSHGSSFEEASWLKGQILKALHYFNRAYYIKNVDYYCCCSVLSANWYYGKKNCEKIPIYVINNGVNTLQFAYDEQTRVLYKKKLCLGNSRVLLHAGRLTAVKNQMYLLDIVRCLVEDNFNVKLLIAGDGELYEQLNNYATSIGISDNVVFLGYRKDIAALCQCSDCFILPSFHEGLPLTIVEAQASGLPCFVSANITRESDISGIVKYLSISEKPSVWAKAIESGFERIIERSAITESIRRNGYDIRDVAINFLKHIEAI